MPSRSMYIVRRSDFMKKNLFRRVGAVEQIVGRHNGLGLGLPHADAEAL